MIALPPRRAQRFKFRDHLDGAFWSFCERKSFPARNFQDLTIAQWLRHRKRGIAVLASAEKFSGAALFQILLSDFESVGCRDHGFDPRQRFSRDLLSRDEYAM